MWLRARPETLASRVGDGAGRPLLGEDPATALVDLDAVRRPLYEGVAEVVVDVDDLAPDEVAERVLAETGLDVVIVVPVELGTRRYEVLVGDGARRELAAVLASVRPGLGRAAVVTQAAVRAAGWFDDLDPGVDPTGLCRSGRAKGPSRWPRSRTLCRDFARAGLARTDVVVAVGGGVVTDVAGFAAAIYHRGVAYVNVATTLLAQVDAAIGGKTGVNLPEGKNLVGAFWQPAAVLCDTETLATLPAREWACGRGEMAKYAFLGDGPPDASLLVLPSTSRWPAAWPSRPRWWRPTSARATAAWSSTTATPWPTPWRPPRFARPGDEPAWTCATARRWRSGSSSPPCWPGGSAGSTTTGSSCTAGWWPASTCRATCPPGPTPAACSRSWPGTRRPTTT